MAWRRRGKAVGSSAKKPVYSTGATEVYRERQSFLQGGVKDHAGQADGAGRQAAAHHTQLLRAFAHGIYSDFRILRHPTMDGIYGVTLRQRYSSDRYSDDGYLFLLWDFRDRSMPVIHVRTWQPASSVADGSEIISIQDFNLQ